MLVAVILSGGAGTRLWPVSREASPKPFMRIGAGPSLLQRTVARAKHVGAEALLIVTNKEYQFRTLEDVAQLPEREAPPHVTLVLEPIGRNTAPAVAAAAKIVSDKYGGDATMLVLPADHFIQNEAAFGERVSLAHDAARHGRIALFGIRPTMPETGFGYIEAETYDGGEPPYVAVRRFIEKPDAQRALQFVAAGNYFWNSGMFAFTARTVLEELHQYAPDVLQAAEAAVGKAVTKTSGAAATTTAAAAASIELDGAAFGQAPAVSLDYAVMERSRRIVVVPSEFGWSDIGSWKAVAAEFQPDARGNSSVGEVIFSECADTHAQSDDRLIAAVGLKNLVIVDTPDALLVCDRLATQQVREVVTELQRRGHEAHRLHRTIVRPWGTYTTLQEGTRFRIKRIEVKPLAKLSLQMHHHRSEHWVVVSGTAKVTIDGKVQLIAPNESTYVPIGAKHRLENPGKVALVMIEVQCGDYVGEDDIVRIDDQYGRVETA